MNTLSYKTVSANKETVTKEWVVIDATNEVLGRLSSKVAKLLRGKYKTNFTPHVDCGDSVIILNVEKIRLTGKKMEEKQYVRHTGYPGGQRVTTPAELMKKDPTQIIRKAVVGMLPKTKLGRQIIKNLHLYVGNEHLHDAQEPKKINLNDLK